jgi:arylformamidase
MFVYKQYDQDGLDKQFNNRLHVPDYRDYFNRWELLGREAEEKYRYIKDVQYGALPRERLDVFPSTFPHSKTLVFIHGGYWQMLDKSMFNFIANGFHACGITTVVINYPLAPEVSIDQIVLSVRRAIGWVYQNVSRFNGNPQQIYVAGHSVGGHLGAMLMATEWELFNHGLPKNVVKGTCVVSGLFNLIPVRLSYLNQVLQIDEQAALRNSPVLLNPSNVCPLIVAVGGMETTEFNNQSEELHDAWKDNLPGIQMLQLPQLNHFSVVEAMGDPESMLNKAIRQMMGC